MIKKLCIFGFGVAVGVLGKVMVDNYFYKMLDEELDKEFEDLYDDLIDDEIDDEVEAPAEDSETDDKPLDEAVESEVTVNMVDDTLIEKADKPVIETSTEEENKEKEV